MKILLTGQTGQLGHILAGDLQSLGQVICLSRAEMDLRQPDQIRSVVRAIRPDLIINPAAYTAVDQAEIDVSVATQINTDAPRILAQEAQALDAGFVHFSTDYIFDGLKMSPYIELDQACPLNIYGKTKFQGEQAIASHSDAYWIFRIGWVYGAHGNNFLKTIVRLAQERQSLNVVADQIGAPTWTKTISQALRQCLQQRPENMSFATYMRTNTGSYHLTANGEVSWHGYAQHIVSQLALLGFPIKLAPDAISAIATADYPAAARRPSNSRLDTHKIRQTFNITLPLWHDTVDQCLAELPKFKQAENYKF
ncbi:dTDP-4-dehydrorhamnose reductase [Herbaspirillum sp. meg3]|uniref:dTDP-4-dehydrorhamnose reductase n=1 Tax=Herbaspirillum sp. meg3 TaxID=2025949 RepID=UPI000B98F130|nr:dTDP-4-dehydrorhamnose reductase [Herbaspirillum sp. meg3]ASU37180.1 dTDP-4-dehydrorhamnose reductase [Herbaspirillum sp. meg3]